MYSWMVLFSLIGSACFIHAFVFRRRRYLIGFALTIALMLYTHNWALFFIAAMLARNRPRLERNATIAGLVLFFGTLLWAFIGSQISPAWAYRYFAAFV